MSLTFVSAIVEHINDFDCHISVIGIEAACHSFVDIFNQTYRNYFCYVCNTDNPEPPELWSCERQNKIDAAPYSMDLSIDLISQIEDGVVLGCDPETQFVDLKQVAHICNSSGSLLNL